MKKIMIAGTKSGVGKTTISMGLMAALSEEVSVQPYKVGPDYIDGAYHTFITGNSCSNLDSYLLQEQMIKYLFNKNNLNKDIAIVEGVMGLFDGAEVGSDIGTSASIAKMLNIPVILVVDGSKVATSLAATVKGFELFDNDLKIAGVIINNVGSLAHYQLLKSAIELYTNVIPCGYLLKNSDLDIPERHLGLVPACEQKDLKKTFTLLGDQVKQTIDIDTILQISKDTLDIPTSDFKIHKMELPKLRIGIARDSAFNFYYQDSLDLLSDYYNVTWVPYSPIQDKKLPVNINGIYIGGGFPEVFAQKISENYSMKNDLLEKLENGLPYLAECGGLMYLSETLVDLEGNSFDMIGWLKGKTEMTKLLQRFGYASLTLDSDTLLGKKGESIKIHEFHRSNAEIGNETVFSLEKIKNDITIKSWECGYQKENGIAAYAHFHFGSNINFGKAFVLKCHKYKNRSL